ncbi:MAG TPA: TonB-dependent receptor [Gemmatimonadaceae bacterium]|jgi:Outer membrane receptor proteins, mostly Fe transport
MNYSLTLILTAAFMLGANGAAPAQITGTVFDTHTSARLANVTVADSSSGATAHTNQDGQFSLPCTGATTLVLRKAGYQLAHRAVASCAEDLKVGLVPGAQSLSAVNVVGASERPAVEQPVAITTLSPRQLQRSTGLFLQDAINLTPGIYMQRRTMSGGQTIRIRGYSNGGDAGNFIGTGYKAYLNGIPVTDAEGQTILDDIDFANIGRVDVIRGPATSIYGAGIGGVVNFYTARPDQLGTAVSQGITSGSDGLLRSDTRLSRVTDGATVVLGYGHQGYDSYRIHSASKKDYGSFLGDFRPSERQTVSTFLSYAHSRDLRAGELDSASFAQELNAGEQRYIDNNARSDIESFRAGVTHSYRLNDHVENVATAYYGGNVLEDVYAAGINSKSNQTFGARLAFNTTFANPALPLRGTTGVDFEKTNVFAQGYGLNNSALGAMRSDIETHNMQYSIFTQWDASLPSAFTLTAGASANFIEYAIVDRMANTANPDHLDGSGRKTFDPVITPTVALRKMFGPHVSAYANVSRGYTPPTSSDAVISYTGEPNDGLEPERATQYEVGSKGSFLGERLSYQVALFDMRVSDKLTPQGVFDTDGTVLYSYTVNAGDQKDRGVEVSAGYALIDNPAQLVSHVRPFASYTYSDFTYSDFRSNNNNDASTVDYSGNDVVGVARNVINFGVDAELRSGVYMNATYHRTDGMPISYDNAHRAPGFSLINAKVGFAHEVGGRFTLDAFAGGENLGNSRYYTQVFLNHKFDSPTPPHMYLPGPYKATYYGGLKVSFRP